MLSAMREIRIANSGFTDSNQEISLATSTCPVKQSVATNTCRKYYGLGTLLMSFKEEVSAKSS